MAKLVDTPTEARMLIGVARRDITPPFGIYGPVWGFSTHDGSSIGTHKPLYATAMAFKSSATSKPAIVVGVDLGATGDLVGLEDEWIRGEVLKQIDIPISNLMLASSHTHGAPWPYRSRTSFPGGEFIEPYLSQLKDAIIQACIEATETAEDAIITFKAGSCDLAKNRNLIDPANLDRYLTGYNPENNHLADDTIMVGRVCRKSDDEIIGTIVNYACHPTTLGGENRLISPDFIGGLRELMEANTHGAPCLFLQGASGDLGPAFQYVADVKVPDRYGAQLGHASMSALLGMYAPGHQLEYVGPIESGAPLAYWEPRKYEVPTNFVIENVVVGLPSKIWPSVEELEAQLANETDPRFRERILRKKTIASFSQGKNEIPTQVFVWRFGAAVMIAVSCEIDVRWQQEIREAFPNNEVVAITDVNYSTIGYIVQEELCELNLYQAWQPPYGKGSFTELTKQCKSLIAKTFA